MGARGRPQEYSDIAIETALCIRQVLHLPLREAEGFMKSLNKPVLPGLLWLQCLLFDYSKETSSKPAKQPSSLANS